MNINEVRAKYPQYDNMSDADLAGALHRKFYPQLSAEDFNQRIGFTDPSGQVAAVAAQVTEQANAAGPMPARIGAPNEEARQRYLKQANGYQPEWGLGAISPRLGALTEATQAGVMAGFDDELSAAANAPFSARSYDELQAVGDQRKADRREAYPGTSIAGEVIGGLALPGMVRATPGAVAVPAASRMPTLFGKVPGALAAPLEGAAYGAAYGAGEAKPGERLEGAGEGAALGAALGTVFHGAGSVVAKARAPKPVPGPAAADVAAQSQAMYRASEAQGVAFKAQPVDRLKINLKLLAGDINDKLRPMTSGTVDDIEKQLNGPLTLEKFDELRQGIGLDLKTAKGKDKLILTRMKEYLDNFADNIAPNDMTGGPDGVKYLTEARKTWAQSKKAETIEKIMDQADVDGSGKYTQSGFANAVRREMNNLYKSIKKGKAQGWSQEEIQLIRQMAKGGSNSKMVNWMAKFSPRGPMSIVLGQLFGSALPGVGNVAIPLAGHAAGQAADRAALAAAERIRSGAATGSLPQIPRLTNSFTPFIPGAVAPTTEERAAIGSLAPR